MCADKQRAAPTLWSYGSSFTSSGAMYRGVPLMDVSMSVLLLVARAKPKSASFTTPFAPIRMFCRWQNEEINQPAATSAEHQRKAQPQIRCTSTDAVHVMTS
jgi:hypothetical protein